MDEHDARLFLLRKYLETSDQLFLRAAEKLRRAPDKPLTGVEILVRAVGKPSVGRPSMSKEDSRLLLEMGKLLVRRECQNTWQAAKRVAKRQPGHSELATAKRLHRKFNRKPGENLRSARFLIRWEQQQSKSLVSGFPHLLAKGSWTGTRFSSRLIPVDRMNQRILRISQALRAPVDPIDRTLRRLDILGMDERLLSALRSPRSET